MVVVGQQMQLANPRTVRGMHVDVHQSRPTSCVFCCRQPLSGHIGKIDRFHH